MKDGENEDHDHIHHRSLWFSRGDVNGHDFWTEGDKCGKIVQDKILNIYQFQAGSGPDVVPDVDVGVIQSQNNWVAADGKVICTDTRTHKFYNHPDGRMIDFDITIHASNGDVTFGDTKEGSMAIRLAPTMQVEGKVAHGHIVNSEGRQDKESWGKRATWCDCYEPVNGQIVGVAIFDHPQNPKHPTWWHVRTYGLFAANPFGIHDFESKPKGTGNIMIPAGQSITFKYRFYFHKGDEKQGRVAEHYREYAAAK
jgi:hypothetical protein